MVARRRAALPLYFAVKLRFTREPKISAAVPPCPPVKERRHSRKTYTCVSEKQSFALAAFEKAVELERTGQTLSALGYASAISGRSSKATTLVKELEERYLSRKALGREIAAVYAGLGDYEKAFSWLEKDFDSRSTELSTISYLPPFNSMRETTRFQDLLRRMGLPAK